MVPKFCLKSYQCYITFRTIFEIGLLGIFFCNGPFHWFELISFKGLSPSRVFVCFLNLAQWPHFSLFEFFFGKQGWVNFEKHATVTTPNVRTTALSKLKPFNWVRSQLGTNPKIVFFRFFYLFLMSYA